ncbi:hypothetical protein ACW9H0_03340 [Pseudomonas monsensis]|uniref:hypothetical protein n=1 Tax=Pseudomonas sp. SC3(2021) TaxID=2871493 RepID=UPI001C9DB97A|nr:hypothetical protein [Pseudomonas sp. SC3(2021)]
MLMNFCNVSALKQRLCPLVAVPTNVFSRNKWGLFKAHDVNGEIVFDAAYEGGNSPRVYGVIEANNGCGIYVPVGRQYNAGAYILPVPICVGGARDLRITALGYVRETDQQVIEREAREELMQPIDILSIQPLATTVAAQDGQYYIVRLKSQLSTFYYSWDVAGSDQVTAVRYWSLPSLIEARHGVEQTQPAGEMAQLLFDDLGCSATHRAAWLAEWHASAYDATIRHLLRNSVRVDTGSEGFNILSRMYGNRKYTYRNQYPAFAPTVNPAHELTCRGRCNSNNGNL